MIKEVVVEPRDGYFVKDARGWYTSASGRARSLPWPQPRTLRGALRAAVGRALELEEGIELVGRLWEERTAGVDLGPSLPLRRAIGEEVWAAKSRMWPVPADAVYRRDRELVQRFEPRRPGKGDAPLVKVDSGLDPEPWDVLWWPRMDDPGKPEDKPRWWSERAFIAWLCGQDVKVSQVGRDAAFEPACRSEAHVGIDGETLAAREAILFSTDVIEPWSGDYYEGRTSVHEWAIAARVDLPAAAGVPKVPLTLGGKRRLCRLSSVEGLFAMPDGLGKAVGDLQRYLRLVVVTPAEFAAGWLPDGFHLKEGAYRGTLPGVGEVILRGAILDRALSVSGYSMVGKSGRGGAERPTARLVPAGSVYHFEREAGSFSGQDLASLWFGSLGARTEEGYGRVVPGLWSPEAGNE